MRLSPTLRRAVREVLSLSLFLLIGLSARSSFADHYEVPSGSMTPTVRVGDHVVVNKAAFGLRVPFTHLRVIDGEAPARGDVVVLESPDDGIVLLKRVVAVPGDSVRVRRGRVVVEGVEAADFGVLNEGTGPDLGPLEVPPDQFLMMGDNRGNSRDGRMFGLVRREAVLGRVVGVFLRDGRPVWVDLKR